jgi:hypothetical protein
MSDSKDNIGSFFKKSFEDFEDLPSKDLWKDISSQIPTYEIGTVPQGESLISEAAKTTVSSGSNAIQTIGAIITKKALIISGSVIMATVGSYVAYTTLSSEAKKEAGIQSVSPAIISDSSVVETQQEKVENAIESPSQTSNNRLEEATESSEIRNEERLEKSKEAPAEAPLKIDSIQRVEHVAAPRDTMSAPKEVKEVVEEKKSVKKETFYEKNAKKHKDKDSSRNVFSPE